MNGRLFAPLQGLNPNNILMGGYGWLSNTDGGATLHPGLDLNSGNGCNDDLGALVVAPLAGVVRAVLYAPSGEGNHVWVELDDPCLPGPTFFHVDHLQSVACAVGQRLAPGEAIGGCGYSGGWECAHGHVELTKGAPSSGYWQWPYGWSRAQVEAEYWNPHEWWAAATALVLAEGHQPIPPEVVMLLNDWQIKHWIMPDLWQWAGVDYNPDAGTSQGWVDALRAGRLPGAAADGGAPLRGGRRHRPLDRVRGGAAALPRGRREGVVDGVSAYHAALTVFAVLSVASLAALCLVLWRLEGEWTR